MPVVVAQKNKWLLFMTIAHPGQQLLPFFESITSAVCVVRTKNRNACWDSKWLIIKYSGCKRINPTTTTIYLHSLLLQRAVQWLASVCLSCIVSLQLQHSFVVRVTLAENVTSRTSAKLEGNKKRMEKKRIQMNSDQGQRLWPISVLLL